MEVVYVKSLHAFFERKPLEELRERGKHNRALHQTYNDYIIQKFYPSKRKPNDYYAEKNINLAYWICSEILKDKDPEIDVWVYRDNTQQEIQKRRYGWDDTDFVIVFVRELLKGYTRHSKYFSLCENKEGVQYFMNNVASFIEDSNKDAYLNFDTDEYKDCFADLDLRISPVPPSEISANFPRPFRSKYDIYRAWYDATDGFVQEDIRKYCCPLNMKSRFEPIVLQ